MGDVFKIDVKLPEELHSKVQILAEEHAVRLEDLVVELLIEGVSRQSREDYMIFERNPW
jgi:hypothetical protein